MRTSWGPIALLLPLASFVVFRPLYAVDPPAPFPTNEQMRHYRTMEDPRLSPDGQQVLVSISDSSAEGGKSHLWLIDIGGKAPLQLTLSVDESGRGESQGQWMPDGQSILFVARRGEHAGLYRIPSNGGSPKPLELRVPATMPDALPTADASMPAAADAAKQGRVERELDVTRFRVAPDGRLLAIIADDLETPDEEKQRVTSADAQWVDHDPHGSRLYLSEVATNKLTPVPVPSDVRSVEWSEDGSRLVVITDGANGLDDLGPARSTWIVAVADLAHPARVAELPPTIESATWSADGRSLFYLAQAKRDTPPGFEDLYEYTEATKSVRDLTDGFEGSLRLQSPIPLTGGRAMQLAEVGSNVSVGIVGAGLSKPEIMSLPIASVSAVATNRTRSGWVFLGSESGEPPALYYAADLTSHPRMLNTPAVASGAGLKPKRISWHSDGFTIAGLLYLPPQAAQHRVPLVVQVHGGPLSSYVDEYAAFVDFLVGHGWAVLRANQRGSLGYGGEFAAANRNDLGGGDFRDIMSGVDVVLKTEPIDEQRMAVIGYSYGGTLAAFMGVKTTRFKAIVGIAPVVDQYSEYGTESSSWEDRWYFGKPWEHPADVWRQSPLSGVQNAKTPFLLLHGERDSAVPVGQSQEMYRALRQVGVPVDLVVYPRDDHGSIGKAINGVPTAQPWTGFDARQRIVVFIQKAFGEVPEE